jgi:hypothetical protein
MLTNPFPPNKHLWQHSKAPRQPNFGQGLATLALDSYLVLMEAKNTTPDTSPHSRGSQNKSSHWTSRPRMTVCTPCGNDVLKWNLDSARRTNFIQLVNRVLIISGWWVENGLQKRREAISFLAEVQFHSVDGANQVLMKELRSSATTATFPQNIHFNNSLWRPGDVCESVWFNWRLHWGQPRRRHHIYFEFPRFLIISGKRQPVRYIVKNSFDKVTYPCKVRQRNSQPKGQEFIPSIQICSKANAKLVSKLGMDVQCSISWSQHSRKRFGTPRWSR